MIPYSVVKYTCGHKYLCLHGSKRLSRCPQCSTVQKTVTIFCRICDERYETTPLGGQRKYCPLCGYLKTQKENREAKQENRVKNPLSTADGIREQQKRLIEVWYQDCRDLSHWQIPTEVRI